MMVQGWVANDPSERNSKGYELVTCTACTRLHLVHAKTGKVVGESDEPLERD